MAQRRCEPKWGRAFGLGTWERARTPTQKCLLRPRSRYKDVTQDLALPASSPERRTPTLQPYTRHATCRGRVT